MMKYFVLIILLFNYVLNSTCTDASADCDTHSTATTKCKEGRTKCIKKTICGQDTVGASNSKTTAICEALYYEETEKCVPNTGGTQCVKKTICGQDTVGASNSKTTAICEALYYEETEKCLPNIGDAQAVNKIISR